jgi:hypothetical protein
MMFRREGRSRSISQRASLGSFATGSLLGFVRKMAAADPEFAVVVVAPAGNPNACLNTGDSGTWKQVLANATFPKHLCSRHPKRLEPGLREP